MDFFFIKLFYKDSLRKKAYIYIFTLAALSAAIAISGTFLIIGFKNIKNNVIVQNNIKVIALMILVLLFIFLGALIVENIIFKGIITSLKNYKIFDNEVNREKVAGDLKEIFAFFEEENKKREEAYSKEIEDLKQQIKRLEYDRKKEIDPESFNNFMEGINELTKTERKIFDLYREGYSVKEILDIANIKESTLRYHNQNIYSKLSVSSLKIMLRYCTLMEIGNQNEV